MIIKILGSLALLLLTVLCAFPSSLEFAIPYAAKAAFFSARLLTAAVGLIFLWKDRGSIAGFSAALIIFLSVAELGANAALS